MSSSVAVHACLSFSLSLFTLSLFLSRVPHSLSHWTLVPVSSALRQSSNSFSFLFLCCFCFVFDSRCNSFAASDSRSPLGNKFIRFRDLFLSHRQRIPVLQVSVDGCSCSGRCRSGGAGAGGGVCLSVCVRLCRCVCVPAVAVSREPATATATQGRTSCRHRLPRLVESCVRVLPM